VAIARGKHPFPSRTRKLSPSAPMVLPNIGWESRSLPEFIFQPPFFNGGFFLTKIIVGYLIPGQNWQRAFYVSRCFLLTAKTHVVRLADVNSPVAQWQSGWLLTTRLAVRVRLGEPKKHRSCLILGRTFFILRCQHVVCIHLFQKRAPASSLMISSLPWVSLTSRNRMRILINHRSKIRFRKWIERPVRAKRFPH
jgi:hypothetical protein